MTTGYESYALGKDDFEIMTIRERCDTLLERLAPYEPAMLEGEHIYVHNCRRYGVRPDDVLQLNRLIQKYSRSVPPHSDVNHE
jgi:hypothetical protein